MTEKDLGFTAADIHFLAAAVGHRNEAIMEKLQAHLTRLEQAAATPLEDERKVKSDG